MLDAGRLARIPGSREEQVCQREAQNTSTFRHKLQVLRDERIKDLVSNKVGVGQGRSRVGGVYALILCVC